MSTSPSSLAPLAVSDRKLSTLILQVTLPRVPVTWTALSQRPVSEPHPRGHTQVVLRRQRIQTITLSRIARSLVFSLKIRMCPMIRRCHCQLHPVSIKHKRLRDSRRRSRRTGFRNVAVVTGSGGGVADTGSGSGTAWTAGCHAPAGGLGVLTPPAAEWRGAGTGTWLRALARYPGPRRHALTPCDAPRSWRAHFIAVA